ncbi:hypothetical protein MY1884_001522 [Beauveria asiatica]
MQRDNQSHGLASESNSTASLITYSTFFLGGAFRHLAHQRLQPDGGIFRYPDPAKQVLTLVIDIDNNE